MLREEILLRFAHGQSCTVTGEVMAVEVKDEKGIGSYENLDSLSSLTGFFRHCFSQASILGGEKSGNMEDRICVG